MASNQLAVSPQQKAEPHIRIVKAEERKPENDAKVELAKIRREVLTIADRIEKLVQGQD